MKKILLFSLLLQACSSVTTNCHSPDNEVGYQGNGRPAKRTVQHMIHQVDTLVEGTAADPEKWPASVYARMEGAACSATLIGERVLLIASHCVSNEGKLSFTARANNYTARCTHHPDYDKDNFSADWTLCLVDRPVTGVLFESLVEDLKLKIGDAITLSGYGCIRPGGGGGNDGIFRVGTAIVEGLPYKTNYDIVVHGGAALCFGDSGGSAYVVKGDKRFVFGVNSRGDIHTTSFLSSVSEKRFKEWARDWALKSNNVKICGLSEEAFYCRNENLNPLTVSENTFEVNSKAACVRGFVNPDFYNRKTDIIQRVQLTLDKLGED